MSHESRLPVVRSWKPTSFSVPLVHGHSLNSQDLASFTIVDIGYGYGPGRG